jgi:hypothetical protein
MNIMTGTCLRHRWFAALAIFPFLVSGAAGQISTGTFGQDILRPSSASYYYIAKPSELSMQVNIWGYVNNPGRYEVATSTDLVELLSYAGGPTADALMDNVRITRSYERSETGPPAEIYLDLEDLANVNSSDLVLYPNDTIFIDHSSWLNIRDVFVVITTAAIVTTAVANVIIAVDRTSE